MFTKTDLSLLQRLLGVVRPYWKMAIFSLLGTAIYGLLEPLVPFITKILIDSGFNQKNITVIYQMVVLMFLGFALRGAAGFVGHYCSNFVAQNVVFDLRNRMFEHMQCLPMHYYQAHSSGEILSRYTYDVTRLMNTATDILLIALREGITIFALIVYLFYLDWKLTLIVFSVTPAIAYLIYRVSQSLRQLANAIQNNMGSINHILEETINGQRVIRIFQAQQQENKRFYLQTRNLRDNQLGIEKIAAMTSPIIEMIIIISLALVIVIAAHKAQSDPQSMTAGTFVSFLGTMALLFPPIKRMSKINAQIQSGLAACHSVFAFLDASCENDTGKHQQKHVRGEVVFADVCFAYGEEKVLHHLNLNIAAGETVAVVGSSGSGKSTLTQLIARFYQPQSGNIYIDGIDIKNYSLHNLRQHLALVSQDVILFNRSIAANIAYGDPAPDEAAIISAAKAANAWEFIEKMPQGLNSDIGEDGKNLSGGQRQRLAIARALYKNAPILILDEATSALDNESEKKVQQAIERLTQGRTSIIIAHRLSTIENADRIVVLEQGEIRESGSHAELLKFGGLYAHLLQYHPKTSPLQAATDPLTE